MAFLHVQDTGALPAGADQVPAVSWSPWQPLWLGASTVPVARHPRVWLCAAVWSRGICHRTGDALWCLERCAEISGESILFHPQWQLWTVILLGILISSVSFFWLWQTEIKVLWLKIQNCQRCQIFNAQSKSEWALCAFAYWQEFFFSDFRLPGSFNFISSHLQTQWCVSWNWIRPLFVIWMKNKQKTRTENKVCMSCFIWQSQDTGGATTCSFQLSGVWRYTLNDKLRDIIGFAVMVDIFYLQQWCVCSFFCVYVCVCVCVFAHT